MSRTSDAPAIGWSRRNTELGLILLGAVITTAGYVLATLGNSAEIPGNVIPFLVVVVALLLAAHVATRRLAPAADGSLLPIAALLNGVGYVFIARLAGETSTRGVLVPGDLPGLQATWTLLGIAAYIVTLAVVPRLRTLEQYRYTFALGGVLLLVLPLAPVIGREVNGARIWVRFGSINLQPGEFAKIALAIFIAGYLVEKRELLGIASRRIGRLAIPELKHLGPVLLAWGISLLVMIFQKDLGTSLLFFALFVVLLWIATERIAYLLLGTVMFGVGAVAAWSVFGHVQDRVTIWLDPFSDPRGAGYQIVQSTFSLADGGLTGTGLGRGEPEIIPEVETDFIFVAIGEELGLLGTTAILTCFLLLIGAGLRIAIMSNRPFDKLLVTGITTLIGLQAFVIIGGIIRVVPLTGITLPFVSYGGSSLLANYILLALLVRASDEQAASPRRSTR